MPSPLDTDSLESRREQICQELATIGDFRRGSLMQRHLRCGKPSCRCRDQDSPGHGPYWYLTCTVGGKSVSRKIPPQAVERTRHLIAEYKRFRTLTNELVEVNEQLCQARLQRERDQVAAAGKKKPLRRPSPPKSAPKSKRS